jgi:hypothetical protein
VEGKSSRESTEKKKVGDRIAERQGLWNCNLAYRETVLWKAKAVPVLCFDGGADICYVLFVY